MVLLKHILLILILSSCWLVSGTPLREHNVAKDSGLPVTDLNDNATLESKETGQEIHTEDELVIHRVDREADEDSETPYVYGLTFGTLGGVLAIGIIICCICLFCGVCGPIACLASWAGCLCCGLCGD